jgi:hypothetical protein
LNPPSACGSCHCADSREIASGVSPK